MLSEKYRLKKEKDFQRIFKKGKWFKEGFLFLKMVENNSSNSRFGFSVGKNFSKKAFLRNRAKRKLRELVKTRIKKIKKGVDVLMMVRSGLEKKSSSEIEENLDNLFRKADLL